MAKKLSDNVYGDYAKGQEQRIRQCAASDYERRKANRNAYVQTKPDNPYEKMSYEACVKRYNIIQGQLLIGKLKPRIQEQLRQERTALASRMAKEGQGMRLDYKRAWE